MYFQFRSLAGILLLFYIGVGNALISSETLAPPVPQAISDLRDSIVKGLGFHGVEGLEISGFDVRDALVGKSIAYEFDIEVDNKVIPFKLLEDVNRWDFVDLPIFRSPPVVSAEDEKALAGRGRIDDGVVDPVLPPFQLSGPMEIWIQNADDMRLALPHDVDAGTLRKVLLSDGAAVTIKGAFSVSLRRPLELPLPLNRTAGLLHLAAAMRTAARSSDQPLLSLRIIGPTSLTSTSSSPANRLKLKRVSPGLVELSSLSIPAAPDTRTFWPLTSLNESNSNLRGFEELLASALGQKSYQRGNFKLLKAEASAQTYVKMAFSVEKKLVEGDVDWSKFQSWKTRPEKATAHFEVLARVEDGRKVVPERIQEVHPVYIADSVMSSVQIGNISLSQLPLMHPPQSFFAI